RVFIATADGEAAKKAVSMVEALTREIKEGEVFLGKVVRIMPFGAFVNLIPGKDGMVHVSELDTQRVENVEDVVKLGDEINVMVIAVEPGTGKVSLSRRAVLTGETPEERRAAGGGRGAGGGGRGGFGGRDRDRDRDRDRPRRRENN
ncbi:MAG TPA: S1 RNA-binding domain-containing protein, partial [Roseiflexaceae bacterium]